MDTIPEFIPKLCVGVGGGGICDLKGLLSVLNHLQLKYLLLLITVIIGCKKHVGMTPNSIPHLKPITEKKENEIELIDTKHLGTKFKEIKEFTVGEHKGISLELFPTKEADYYQFYICSLDQKNCNPSKDDPKKFYLTTHQFASPPTGKIEVFAASCVNTKRAKDPAKNCGIYSKALFYMSQGKETDTKVHLEEREEIIEKNREVCHDFFDNIEVYYNKMVASYNFSQDALLQAVQKQLDMGKELSCELIYSTVYQDLIKQETPKPRAITDISNDKKRVWTPAAITLVTLGSISVSIGAAYIVKGMYATNFSRLLAKSLALTQKQDPQYTEALKNIEKNRTQFEQKLNKSIDELNLANKVDIEKKRLMDKFRDLYNNYAEAIKQGKDALHANKIKIEKSIK